MMNELILNANGTVTTVGDAGSVEGILARYQRENTTPATHDIEGVELTPEIVPDADTLAVEVLTAHWINPDTGEEEPDHMPLLQTHAWRLPKVREERLEQLRNMRNAKLDKIDDELKDALIGRPGADRTIENSEAEKQTLRDMPINAGSDLKAMKNTDDMEAYTPDELK